MNWIKASPALLVLLAVHAAVPSAAADQDKGLSILCTTFPVHQIARNVAQGRAGVSVELMLPPGLGCPHDYALTPQDMRKLSKADVLVVNGLGMEEFLGAPVSQANPKLSVIDSSAGIHETLNYSGDGCGHGECQHHHVEVNPHLFTSPRLSARLAMNIADGLAKIDPAGADAYKRNADAYAKRMGALAEEAAALGARLKNKRIVQPHGVMDYVVRDMGLEIVATTQAHGQDPSAAQMLALLETVRASKPAAIFHEPQYSDKVAAALSRETGVPSVVFDPVASGPENAPLDYYDSVLRRNLKGMQEAMAGR